MPRTRSYQSPFDLSEQTILRFRANYEWYLAPNFTLRDKLYYTSLDWPLAGHPLQRSLPQRSRFDWISLETLLDSSTTSSGSSATGLEGLLRLQTGGIEHQLLFGRPRSPTSTDDFTLDVALLSFVDLFTLDATLPPSLAPFMPAEGQHHYPKNYPRQR